MKPADNQIKEFVRKIKTLDKEFIFNKIGEKLANYENVNDQNQFKITNVCKSTLNFRNVYM